MATNLSDIGFSAQAGPEYEALARKCFQNGHASRCPSGTYIGWNLGGGIELWIQLTPGEELVGLTPHFFGKTRISAGLCQRVTRAGFALEGGFVALAQPYGCDPIRGAFRFVFDTPDFHVHDELPLPQIRSVQLTAFAHQCVVAPNEQEFRAARQRAGQNLPSDALIPVGMLGPDRKPLAEPAATAMVCGTILDVARLTNPMTKAPFWWLRLRNAAGEIDVVADPELLPRAPHVGGVLQCSAWLSGRLV